MKTVSPRKVPQFAIDAIDRRILAVLQEDASMTNVDVAGKVGLSPSPCLARVRALEQAGVILRRVALLDRLKLGASISVFIQVTLESRPRRSSTVSNPLWPAFPRLWNVI